MLEITKNFKITNIIGKHNLEINIKIIIERSLNLRIVSFRLIQGNVHSEI